MFKIFNDKSLFSNVIIFICLSLFAGQSGAAVTPSDVYHKVSVINAELKLIRHNLGITKEVREPALQANKIPAHVYIKSLELFNKVSKLQEKHGVASKIKPEILIKDISLENVLSLIDSIHSEVIRIKNQLGINQLIKKIEFYAGRTPSNVYENVWQSSYLIDSMIKDIGSVDVLENTLRIQSELNLIASHLNVELPNVAGEPQSGKSPKQVHLQGYINLHKFSLLEEALKMKAFRVSAYPKTKVSPSDVYDTTNMMLAEINRIKFHFGIEQRAQSIKQSIQSESVLGRKSPPHVLVQMNLINDQLVYLTGVSQ